MGERTRSHEQEILDSPHTIEVLYDDGHGHWSLVCDCGWETWGAPTEERARKVHAAHTLSPLDDHPLEGTCGG